MNTQRKGNQNLFKFTTIQQFDIDHTKKLGPHDELVKMEDLNEYLFLDMLLDQLPSFRAVVKDILRDLEASVENHLRYVKNQVMNGDPIDLACIERIIEDIRPVVDLEEEKQWLIESAEHVISSPYMNLMAGVLAKLQVANDYLNSAVVPKAILAYSDTSSILHNIGELAYEEYDSSKILLNVHTGKFIEQ